jgi:CBS domain-containing protein/sporulation protein YlmC with PRC-barrel domain
MNPNLQGKFIFSSQIIKIPVFDNASGKKIGRSVDIAVILKEMYPRVSGFIMKTGFKRYYIPWKNVRKVTENRSILIEVTPELFTQPASLPEGEIPVKEILWDKQIVDTSGSKVVRINDLHMLKEDLKLWIIHVDIGFTGLIRRLGWSGWFIPLVKLCSSYEMQDRLIPWKFVQPVSSDIGYNALSLKVHQSRLADLHPADLADILIDLGTEERMPILQSLDNVTASRTFQELPMKIRLQIAMQVPHLDMVRIINDMAVDEVVDLLSQLPQRKANALLSHIAKDKAEQIAKLLKHAERTAGSIMNTEFLAVKMNYTAAMVLEKVKSESRKKESIYYIYVLDDNDALAGMITLRDVLTVDPVRVISEFMRKRVAKVRVDTNIKDVAEVFYKYDFTVVPVVDKQNKIQGIITMKDAFESVFSRIRKETEETT